MYTTGSKKKNELGEATLLVSMYKWVLVSQVIYVTVACFIPPIEQQPHHFLNIDCSSRCKRRIC